MSFTYDDNWGDNILDSNDIVERFEELESELQSLKDSVEDLEDDLEMTTDPDEIENINTSLKLVKEQIRIFLDIDHPDSCQEYHYLKDIIAQGEHSSNWVYGEVLIHDNYFMEYIQDLIEDCYDLPSELDSGKWPWRHLEMNWQGAAESAKQDYTEIYLNGKTYYILS